jgi:hypothetical protein
MFEPQMLIYAQCGRRHYPTNDLAANVADYKQAFGLPESTKLIGRVHRQFDAARNPTDPGVPIEVDLASAVELAAKAGRNQSHPTTPSSETQRAIGAFHFKHGLAPNRFAAPANLNPPTAQSP